MVIKKLSLLNFRNYEILNLDLHDKINIICGKNGQGKTNILESIYVLGLTKSHRSIVDDTLINNSKDFSKIRGIILEDDINSYLVKYKQNKLDSKERLKLQC